MSHPSRTELPKKDFRWNNGVLEQKIQIIQHHPTESRTVGLYIEWHPVVAEGDQVKRSYIPYSASESSDASLCDKGRHLRDFEVKFALECKKNKKRPYIPPLIK